MRESGSMKTMKKMFAMAFMAVVGFAGCQQELVDPDAVESDALKVYATIEDADDTKTYLNDKEVYWTSGDRIAVFMNKTLRKRFEVSSESVGTKEGTFIYDSDYIVTGKSVAISNNVAYYPFCEVTCAVSGSTYTLSNVTIPTTQDYAPASFGQGAFPMVAVTADTDDLDFAFKNLCGVLAFQLKGSGTVRSITVEGNSDEILSGKATVTASFGKNPEISLLPDGSKTVTLDCGETGVALQNDTPTSFFIALPPVSFDKGFTITVTDASGATKEYSTSKKNVIHRSGILRMPEKEYVGEKVPQEGDYVDEYGINHGQGVKIGETVWAPVNCGYHATDFPGGKYYQWGRKYGQVQSEYFLGFVSITEGNSKHNQNVFYEGTAQNDGDWLTPHNNYLWNAGTENNPVKTKYDPCPSGWRVPTSSELFALKANRSKWTQHDGHDGYWFSGGNVYSAAVNQIFLPAMGYKFSSAYIENKYTVGYYWSSEPTNWTGGGVNTPGASELMFGRSGIDEHASVRFHGNSVRCVQDDSALVPVESVTLNKTSMTLSVGVSETLLCASYPSHVDFRAVWRSDDPEVAMVDSEGKVTAVAVGTTTVYAVMGGKVATCQVIVVSSQKGDYIDEYGINYGQGIKVDDIIWAPVNCGYHKDDYKYGKLYQWGRKYGQGYDGKIWDGDWDQTYSDARVPTIEKGGISADAGNDKGKSNIFYADYDNGSGDWVNPHDDKLWNSGTEQNPVKTKYDPCPDGWRVPTYAELNKFRKNSSFDIAEDGLRGYSLSGANSYDEAAFHVFLPFAGSRNPTGSVETSRGSTGNYWSSNPDRAYAKYLEISYSEGARMFPSGRRASAFSVRCVRE